MVFKKLMIYLMIGSLVLTSCSTRQKIVEDDFGVEDVSGTELTLDESAGSAGDASIADEFAEFDNPSSTNQSEANQNSSTPETSATADNNTVADNSNLDSSGTDTLSAPTTDTETQINTDSASSVGPSGLTARISDVLFKANDNGGTLVITADNPLQFKTRTNSNTNQLIVEVENAVLPERLKRPLITKDMTSNIGSVDIYQNPNSSIARFVVQLRPGSQEPLVQPEGNTLLVIGSPTESLNLNLADSGSNLSADPASDGSTDGSVEGIGIMKSDSIEDFLASNNKFYGRKISIETTDMDVRDVLKFISEEAGINMIFDENVQGRVSLKLRKVPWDQALVTVLQSKKLAYRRQGQVLRVALVEVLAKEEEDALKLREAKAKLETLVVKNFSINYADVTALEAKIKDFIIDGSGPQAVTRGKVTVDNRTNSLIVTETASKLAQVEKLIRLLDSQPQQVLIEGRVVEASENYARQIGVNFGFNLPQTGDANLVIPGRDRFVTGSTGRFYSPSATFNPSSTGSFTGSLWVGQFGAFGDLSTRLALDEVEEKVKILSSPRIAVLHNNQATIKQGSVIQVPTSETSTPGTTTVTQTFKEVEVGVNLDVKPLISSIGTVNLDLKIERSATTPTGGRTQREVKTNIIVKSGETAVIGGVFTSDVTSRRTGIPGLKDIPILGTLFRTDSNSSQKTELMFFISPRIIKSLDIPVFKASSQDLDGAETSAQ